MPPAARSERNVSALPMQFFFGARKDGQSDDLVGTHYDQRSRWPSIGKV